MVKLELLSTFPRNRLGALGDVPKVNCTTCHNGVSKPLNGAHVVEAYPELARSTETASAAVPKPTEMTAPETTAPVPGQPAMPIPEPK